MIARLRRTLCVISLALWVVTGFLAVRSEKSADVAEWRRVGRVYGVRSRSDCLTVYVTTFPLGEVTPAAGCRWYHTDVTGPADGESFYFGPATHDPAYAEAGIRRTEATAPYWFVMVCASVLPTWRLAAHLARRYRLLQRRSGGFAVVGGFGAREGRPSAAEPVEAMP
jgi:hypothetical protein